MQVVLDSGDYPKCQEMVLAASDWERFAARQAEARASGRYLGLGLANFVKGTGRGPFEPVTVRIGPSGRVNVYTGAAAMGQSTKTMLAQIVADQLGGAMENISVVTGDTAEIAMGIGGFNSRQAVLAGSSAHLAATKVREKAMAVASSALNAPKETLEFDGSGIGVRDEPKRRISLGNIARALGGTPGFALPEGVSPGLEATECFVCNEMAYANGAAVAEVEVDPETGGVTVCKIVIAHDCGRAINPMIVEGQIVGAVAHGIGNTLYEWMGFDENCQPTTATFADYLLVTSTEIPPIEVLHMESPSPLNPLGVKGVGECGVLPIAPAIVSAIEDALSPFGVHIAQAPIFPSMIVELIEAGRRGTARDHAL
jgi:carbon-monoxide dehydrogenase large subunit